jgi:hypothetical protein
VPADRTPPLAAAEVARLLAVQGYGPVPPGDLAEVTDRVNQVLAAVEGWDALEPERFEAWHAGMLEPRDA